MKANYQNFINVYLSNREVCVDVFINDYSILMWDNMCLMSPSCYAKYQEFVDKFEKERPLLVELR